jgi:Ser/Thr protein kinase RdoA (MazF antagonist)
MPDNILAMYGIQKPKYTIQTFGDGLINRTWKVTTDSAAYILQQVNQAVFKNPIIIDQNVSRIKAYLNSNYPSYLFISPLFDVSGASLVESQSGCFRLFPFVANSHALNVVNTPQEAFEAARQFGKFTRLLNDFEVSELKLTLPDFHNLSLRYDEFLTACETASAERKQKSGSSIMFIKENKEIVSIFKKIVDQHEIPQRVIHHDTKINNVLFDKDDKGICVIDLDTVMPGYFISDVGDMIRTYVSPSGEEETNLAKINVRKPFFRAIYDGYMEQMGDVLTSTEKAYFIYAGKFMIFMQGLRFLTDYLENDVYYGQKYEGHNLCRAENQITLLQRYLEIEEQLKQVIAVPT